MMRLLVRAVAVAGVGLLFFAVTSGPASAALQPSAYIVPNPSGSGQQVTLVGQGFCGSSSCSPVTVTIDEQTVAADVAVNADGSFSAGFRVSQPPGSYQVIASQQTPTGELSTQARMMVVPQDLPPSQSTATTGSGGGATGQNPPSLGSPGSSADSQRNVPPAGASGTAENSSTAAHGGGASWWPWLVGAAGLVVLAGAALLVLRARRSRPN